MGPLLLGIKRRRLWSAALYLPLLPIYYALMSLAAWGALIELCRDPFAWNKTEHGLAKSSTSKPAKISPGA